MSDSKETKPVVSAPTLWTKGSGTIKVARRDEKGQWVEKSETVVIPLISSPFVGYRGDDREPATIFKDGFSPRVSAEPQFRASTASDSDDRTLRTLVFETAGDMTPANVVCVSTSLGAAALFPLPAKKSDSAQEPPDMKSYIYVIWVETAWNTSHVQVCRALDSWTAIKDKKLPDDVREAVGSTLFGREQFCKRIKGKRIIGAIECTRRFNNWTYQGGGQYLLDRFIANTNCKVTSSIKDTVVTAIRAEIARSVKPKLLPTPGMGFHRSTPKALGPDEAATSSLDEKVSVESESGEGESDEKS